MEPQDPGKYAFIDADLPVCLWGLHYRGWVEERDHHYHPCCQASLSHYALQWAHRRSLIFCKGFKLHLKVKWALTYVGLKIIFHTAQQIRDWSNKAFLSSPPTLEPENFCYGTCLPLQLAVLRCPFFLSKLAVPRKGLASAQWLGPSSIDYWGNTAEGGGGDRMRKGTP